MTLSDVARVADMTRATARRYLLTLVAAGYARSDGKYFRLAPRTLRLGYSYLTSEPLPPIVQPCLDDIAERTGEAAAFGILDGFETVIIASSVQRRIVGAYTRVGTRLPVTATSTGRILLAGHSDASILALIEARGGLIRLTGKTKTSPEEILSAIRDAAARGYAINDEEVEVGLRVISVPIHDGANRLVGALALSVFSGRFEIEELRTRFLPLLQAWRQKLQILI